MATGAPDSNGIWIYGEDDSETTFSALLNKLGTSASSALTTKLNALPGKVKQVQYVEATSEVSTTSSTPTSTGASISFTPTSATSKIVIQAVINGIRKGPDSATAAGFQIQKDGSGIQTMYAFSAYTVPAGQYFSVSGQKVETAGSTTARTYRTTIARSTGSQAISCQGDGGVSSLIIWEISQ